MEAGEREALRRIACIDLPALPLQLARRAHPEWRGHAAVVVDKDSPRGLVLWANERARKLGILPGLRYAEGLSLDASLRACTVEASELRAAIDELTVMLRRFSPAVEPSPFDAEPGIFWLDASGLSLLYPSLSTWAEAVRAALAAVELAAGVAVGYSRYGSYATARALAGRSRVVWDDAAQEQRAAAHVPLHRTALDDKTRAALAQLGVQTLGQLAQLPEAGLRRRFGKETHRLRQLAAGTREEPLAPAAPQERHEQRLDFDDPVADRQALAFFAKQLLDPLLGRLASRGQALAAMRLAFEAPPRPALVEELRPAVPTLDAPQLLGLIRLRLERLDLGALSDGARTDEVLPRADLTGGARGLSLLVEGQPASREQLALFFDTQVRPRRDRAAGDRALARLRAALGEDAVVRARLRSGHLPEASYAWEPFEHLVEARPRRALLRPLVRRLATRPEPLPSRPGREPDGWLLRGIARGPVARLSGPFCLSGGWWNANEVRRDYYFAELASGTIYWIFYDQRRRRWYLHGELA